MGAQLSPSPCLGGRREAARDPGGEAGKLSYSSKKLHFWARGLKGIFLLGLMRGVSLRAVLLDHTPAALSVEGHAGSRVGESGPYAAHRTVLLWRVNVPDKVVSSLLEPVISSVGGFPVLTQTLPSLAPQQTIRGPGLGRSSLCPLEAGPQVHTQSLSQRRAFFHPHSLLGPAFDLHPIDQLMDKHLLSTY